MPEKLKSKLLLQETDSGFNLKVQYETTDDLIKMLAYLRSYTLKIYQELSVRQFIDSKGKQR